MISSLLEMRKLILTRCTFGYNSCQEPDTVRAEWCADSSAGRAAHTHLAVRKRKMEWKNIIRIFPGRHMRPDQNFQDIRSFGSYSGSEVVCEPNFLSRDSKLGLMLGLILGLIFRSEYLG